MKTKELVFCAVFVALVAISSMITIPIGPVPITLQTPMVILTGALLGRRLGVITMVVYLIAGLIGAPVFAGGSGGIGSLTSPSFGFVLGFIPLAYFSGLGNSGGKNTFTAILTTLFGMIILFTIGFLYFYFIMNVVLESPTGLAESIMITVAPFIIKDLIVTVVVVLFAHTLVRRGITPQT